MHIPRVIDCVGPDFGEACTELARRVHAADAPDLWVGIESGGAVVVDTMRALGAIDDTIVRVRASRPTTAHKKHIGLDRVLPWFPRWLANWARIAEHWVRERQFERDRGAMGRDVSIPKASVAAICAASMIVIVDDAIDTGSSVVQVEDAIRRLNPKCTIRVAAIVQTFGEPLRSADFAVHRSVLVRFPWSIDTR